MSFYYFRSSGSGLRIPTRQVMVGGLSIGGDAPIRIQTMTTTDTMDTIATVEQSIRCIEAGAELVRITAPSKREAENLLNIKNMLRERGYNTPLVADIHFTPNAAEIAARIVEKVRVNPGNYIDKKKFEHISYTDAEYGEEVDRIRARFTPLVRICKEYGTAMRIGTNHGSLSDRIMSRYGDTPIGMVESAMEFLRIARDENYHQVILSMKSSNPQVMVQAYRLLVTQMQDEFGECYPLHLGVTEAGDGFDGRIKSAIGIGTLLEDGIGDTIRVSLTEEPEAELPVCRAIADHYETSPTAAAPMSAEKRPATVTHDPFSYRRRETTAVGNIGHNHVPVVVTWHDEACGELYPATLQAAGYTYMADTDKWRISDQAADYLFTGSRIPDFPLPEQLKLIVNYDSWKKHTSPEQLLPCLTTAAYMEEASVPGMHFVMVNLRELDDISDTLIKKLATDNSVVVIIAPGSCSVQEARAFFDLLIANQVKTPVIYSRKPTGRQQIDQLVQYAADCGGLLLDGLGDGISLVAGKATAENLSLINSFAFIILQATRTRISKTEYISCPSCGRTLFDLQETTAKIRSATHHLKGVKIAIMGCIVNGPGEMADADFGYVGSGPGKITLYKGKEVVKRNVPSEIAVEELIGLLKDNDAWADMPV